MKANCPRCLATGKIMDWAKSFKNGANIVMKTCTKCKGTGIIESPYPIILNQLHDEHRLNQEKQRRATYRNPAGND